MLKSKEDFLRHKFDYSRRIYCLRSYFIYSKNGKCCEFIRLLARSDFEFVRRNYLQIKEFLRSDFLHVKGKYDVSIKHNTIGFSNRRC
jgi:hypothetical protein